MNIRTKVTLSLVVVFLVNLGAGLYGLHRYNESSVSKARVYEEVDHIVATSLTTQVNFKKQVQEWKNILLRGQDPELYDQYLHQFDYAEQQTRSSTETLIELLAETPAARSTAVSFLAAHLELGHAYREALSLYRPEQPNAHLAVDARVRGVDRQPTDILDDVVAAAQAYKATRLREIEVATRRIEQRILLLVTAIMSSAVLIVFWLINRTVGRPIGIATNIARRISAGDLTSPIEFRGRDESAQLLLALRTMQDNLSESQQTLRQSEERNRLLLESAGEGIYGLDTRGRCMFCNPAGAAMLGYAEPAELLGRHLHELMHHSRPDGSPLTVEECRASETFRTGEPAHVDDEVFWRPDGSSFPVEYRSHPIYQDNNLIGAVVNFSDITARKEAGAALREAHDALLDERKHLEERVKARTAELNQANAELAKSARAKDKFFASISHELRTPLTSILGLSEILGNELMGSLNEDQKKAARTIRESGHHLLSLINDILDVAKAASAKMTLAWDLVPVHQLCDASLRMVTQATTAKNIQVFLSIDPELRLVRGDSRRLKQVLVNLLGNAVKFTPNGGSIGLDVTSDASANQVRFGVWDTGIGIPPEQRDQLFKPFVQLESNLARQHTGTGLGLALVHSLVELHHGSVSVASDTGGGSRFEVILPWDPKTQALPEADAAASQTAPADTPPGCSPRVSILVADDNEANASMITIYLESLGYNVILAHDGAEVLAAAKSNPPDLIVMDIQMPRMDGLEATRRLRAMDEFANTPIVALTALAATEDRERCLEAGADEYLSKPVGLSELRETILTLLQRSRRR